MVIMYIMYQKILMFNPPPKVKSCLVEFKKKDKSEDIDFDKLVEFLDLYTPFSRKTLWAINKILAKQGKKYYNFSSELFWKRVDELQRHDLIDFLENQIPEKPKELKIKERNPLDVVYDGMEDDINAKTVEHMDNLTSYEVSYV